jgi:hypothetical protein
VPLGIEPDVQAERRVDAVEHALVHHPLRAAAALLGRLEDVAHRPAHSPRVREALGHREPDRDVRVVTAGVHHAPGPETKSCASPRGSGARPCPRAADHPSTYAKTSGATIEASDSIMYFGVSTPSLPQVIFSFGTAPE